MSRLWYTGFVPGAQLIASIAMMASVAACGEPGVPPPLIPTSNPPPATSAPASAAPPTVTSVDTYAQPGFVDLAEVDPTIIQEIRYYTGHNFVGRQIEGYLEPRCLLTEQAAEALHRAQTAARGKGYSLKVYDCYRPLRAGEDFKQWAKRPDDQAMKAEFFPQLSKAAVFADGFVSGGRSTHSSGSTVDLTLVALPAPAQRLFVKGEPLTPCTAPAAQRFPDNTIDMGTGYDCFDTRSHTLDSRITGQARLNRLLLRQLMTEAGFRSYANEWWHFRLVNDPHPNAYYDFPVARAALR